MVEGGKNHPSQEDKAQKRAKQAKVGQKGVDQRGDSQVAPLSWTPTPMLDGAHLPANASIRDFRGGKAGYVVDVVEQALLILEDMADLGSLRRHEVFLSLKRDLVMVSLKFTLFSSFFFFYKFPPLTSFYHFPLLTFTMFLSSASCSSHVSGRGDNQFLPSPDEGRRREAQCYRRGLQSGRKKNK